LIDGEWKQNPEHEEEVTLLEYFTGRIEQDPLPLHTMKLEGILFLRENNTLGRDRIDSFTIIPDTTGIDQIGRDLVEKVRARTGKGERL